MGMNTAVANTDQWQRQFGVDVEEIDQWEIVRRAEAADEWPHAFARLDAPAEVFLSRFGANHIHAVCQLLDVSLDEFTQ